MKDNLIEMLYHLFESGLAQINKEHQSLEQDSSEPTEADELTEAQSSLLFVNSAQSNSIRVLTPDEQNKLTKASYQFLMRLKLWGIIDEYVFESVFNEILYSNSRIITLQEIKWTIRHILEDQLDEKQLAFLDLVLYQKEDILVKH